MIPTTANFDAKRNAGYQEPIYTLSFSGAGAPATVYSSRSTTFAGWKPWLKIPGGRPQTVSDLAGKSSIGELRVEIVDINRAILALFSSVTWYGLTATLQVGFTGLALADYITLYTGLVEKLDPAPDTTSYYVVIRDKKRTLKTKAYTLGDDGLTATSKKNFRTVDGNPLQIALNVLETELSIPVGSIDTAAFTSLQNGRFAATRCIWRLDKAVEALQWLENEICRANGLYMFVRYDGRVSIHDMLAPSLPAAAFALTDSNIIGIPTVQSQTIVNLVEGRLDFDGQNFLTSIPIVDGTSVNKYGLGQNHVIESRGLRTNLQGASRIGIAARRIFQRYGNPTGRIRLAHSSLQGIIVEVGDYVSVTHRLLPNLTTGTVGVTARLYEVLGVTPRFDRGQIEFDLLDVSVMSGRTALQYAPDAIPVWTAATAAQKAQYLFQAADTGLQSDGTLAGRIF